MNAVASVRAVSLPVLMIRVTDLFSISSCMGNLPSLSEWKKEMPGGTSIGEGDTDASLKHLLAYFILRRLRIRPTVPLIAIRPRPAHMTPVTAMCTPVWMVV